MNAHHRNDPSSPWGGIPSMGSTSSSSGMGKENGIEALNAYSVSKSICLNLSSVEKRRSEEDWFGFVEKEREQDGAKVRYG